MVCSFKVNSNLYSVTRRIISVIKNCHYNFHEMLASLHPNLQLIIPDKGAREAKGNSLFYEGHLQSSWTHLTTPSQNFIEVQ